MRDPEFVELQAKMAELTVVRMTRGRDWQDRVLSALVNALACCIVSHAAGERTAIAGLIDEVVTELYEQTSGCSAFVEGEARKRGESNQ